MLALVTGSTGFLGRHLIERLQQGGWRVRALTRDAGKAGIFVGTATEVVRGDLTAPPSLAPGGCCSAGPSFTHSCVALSFSREACRRAGDRLEPALPELISRRPPPRLEAPMTAPRSFSGITPGR